MTTNDSIATHAVVEGAVADAPRATALAVRKLGI